MKHSRRGQAVVELALGLLVFITVLLFGIHFAEVGYLQLKVQESAAASVWESTRGRVQTAPGGPVVAPFRAGDSDVIGPAITARYEDFNGLSTVNRAPGTVSKALTNPTALRASCERQPRLRWAATNTANDIYRNVGGYQCNAEARLDAVRIPSAFADEADGFFKAPHRGPLTYKVCGMGPLVGGNCTGRMAVLLNDWGLAGSSQYGSSRTLCGQTGGCGNVPYRNAVASMWGGGGGAGRAFADKYAGGAPTDANEFAFGYSGHEYQYESAPYGDEGGNPNFNVGGVGPNPLGGILPPTTGHNCFLGKSGPGCP